MNYQDVYTIISRIPSGKVTTYQQIATELGSKSARWIGNALHANIDPGKIPCHRVIKSNGQLAEGYAFGGKVAQRKMLEAEGIKFIDKISGQIDLTKDQYQF